MTDLRDDDTRQLRQSVLAENDIGVEFYESEGFERIRSVHDDRLDVPRYEYEKTV